MPWGITQGPALPTAPHIEAVFARIDREMARCARTAFLHHMMNAVQECIRADGCSRAATLERCGITDMAHEAVIAALRARLARNRAVKVERPGSEMIPANEWWLCGALIAEGRLRRSLLATPSRVFRVQRSGPNVNRGKGADDDGLEYCQDDRPAVQGLER